MSTALGGKKIVAVVPAFNEEKYLGRVLEQLALAKKQGIVDEIVVVNDASSDKTREIAESFKAVDRVINFRKNRGKGAAVLAGLSHANRAGAEAVVVLDADILNPSPEMIGKLLEPLKKEEIGMVIGKRADGQVQYSGERALRMSSVRKFLVNRNVRRMMYESGYAPDLLLNYAFGRSGQREFDMLTPENSPTIAVAELGTRVRSSQIELKSERAGKMKLQLEGMYKHLAGRGALGKLLFHLPFSQARELWLEKRKEFGFGKKKRK